MMQTHTQSMERKIFLFLCGTTSSDSFLMMLTNCVQKTCKSATYQSLSALTGSLAARAMDEAMMTNMMNTSKSGNVTMEWMAHRKPFSDEKMNMEE